jgi:hypothetical protein
MFNLPALQKRVIYLDQFVISNLMKSLDTSTKGHGRTAADPFWLKLFDVLEFASKMQIIVCPDSDEHHQESLVSPFYQRLKRIYQHFSNGISFHDSRTIRRIQLVEIAERWLSGEKPEWTLDPRRVTCGDLHGWQSPISVSVSLQHGEDVLEEIRAVREQVHQEMQNAFQYWKSEKLSFDERFANEVGGYGKKLLIDVAKWREVLRELQFGPRPIDQREIYTPPAVEILVAVITAFRQRALAEDEAWDRAIAFFSSDVPSTSPRRQIFGLLYAALAWRTQNGQTHAPNQGMVNDITVISDLLPYCDAMFLDNSARALLLDIPSNRKPPYSGEVFSPNVRDDFLAYLEDLITGTSEEHRTMVREVYGEGYTKPYHEILRR